jgi:hypothetical protein
MPDPFCEAPEPLWRRVWRRRREQGAAPKRWATAAGTIGPVVLFLVPAGHMDAIDKLAISFAILALPPALVGLWWKKRRRRASEELLVWPDLQRSFTERRYWLRTTSGPSARPR